MPREDRRIIFDYEETYKAVYALYLQREGRKLTPGYITSISIDKNNSQSVNFVIENPQEDAVKEVSFAREFLVVALMLYCRSLNIPISKNFRKALELEGKSVILHLVM